MLLIELLGWGAIWISGGLCLGWAVWGSKYQALDDTNERLLTENLYMRETLNTVDPDRCPTLPDRELNERLRKAGWSP